VDKETKELIKVLSVPAAFILAPVIILAAFSIMTQKPSGIPDTPPWDGEGDWLACAEVASVSPDEALHIVSRSTNLSNAELQQRYATIEPVYINTTGAVFELTCSNGMRVGQHLQMLPEYPTSVSHYAWAVSIYHPNTGCMPAVGYVEWQIRQQTPQYVSPC